MEKALLEFRIRKPNATYVIRHDNTRASRMAAMGLLGRMAANPECLVTWADVLQVLVLLLGEDRITQRSEL